MELKRLDPRRAWSSTTCLQGQGVPPKVSGSSARSSFRLPRAASHGAMFRIGGLRHRARPDGGSGETMRGRLKRRAGRPDRTTSASRSTTSSRRSRSSTRSASRTTGVPYGDGQRREPRTRRSSSGSSRRSSPSRRRRTATCSSFLEAKGRDRGRAAAPTRSRYWGREALAHLPQAVDLEDPVRGGRSPQPRPTITAVGAASGRK